ncbi:DUF4291 domain-containing protein [Oryzifoliimicrobium ureilyticus]|uniref:DUF4291 domain-containing protein n=1 Tax=Oryzifoliimicrobium ureilyticus TaxID=3113724 RepID=UPI0030760D77
MRKEIRAVFDESTVTVYQAFNDEIANHALATGNLRHPSFSLNRMTWIKPSFFWMMYRCNWGLKDVNQSRILEIKLERECFQVALSRACLSRFDPSCHPSVEAWRRKLKVSDVRVQWDPERDINMEVVEGLRSIQIGLSGAMIAAYSQDWIRSISDITDEVAKLNRLRMDGKFQELEAKLNREKPYPISEDIALELGASIPRRF